MNSYQVLFCFVFSILQVSELAPTIKQITNPSDAKVLLYEKAVCKPEMRTYKLVHHDSAKSYHPKCVRTAQCGGCCSSELLECQPKEIVYQNISVQEFQKVKYSKGTPASYLLPVHTKCTCVCKIKATDCAANQTYNEDECQCDCNDTSEKDTCHMKGLTWLPNICACGKLQTV